MMNTAMFRPLTTPVNHVSKPAFGTAVSPALLIRSLLDGWEKGLDANGFKVISKNPGRGEMLVQLGQDEYKLSGLKSSVGGAPEHLTFTNMKTGEAIIYIGPGGFVPPGVSYKPNAAMQPLPPMFGDSQLTARVAKFLHRVKAL